MAFIKRLSDSLWDYVSPRKAAKAPLPTPQSDAVVYKKPLYPASARKASLDEIGQSTRSMSPSERVRDWRVRPTSSPASAPVTGHKRKRLHTPSSSGRSSRVKQPKIEVEDMDFEPQTPIIAEYEEDSVMEDYINQSPYLRTPSQRYSRTKSPTLDEMADELDDMSLVVDDEAYHNSPQRRKLVMLPPQIDHSEFQEEELRKQGWDDDYISLLHRILKRGYEPLLPAYMKFEYNFLPDGFFEKNDDAIIGSISGKHFHASKALQHLLDLGGRVRDRKYLEGPVEPEEEIRRAVRDYNKWAQNDAGLDKKTAIPVMVQEYQPAETHADLIKENAEAKCRELAKRWKNAFRVARSVEFSPASRSSNHTLLSYELPTFYVIAASYTLACVMAYRVDTDECSPMAYLDFQDPNYDVWNSLAMALVICHARDVQVRIADETMIGQKRPGSRAASMAEDDPDA
ncbi:hypothetical protein HII31_01986 [Pseudocercospora fuligena]|uniref:Uncharacterized protein n=1 Tax=Pseudocercospora fuligena TaxID=685502 RepID=A0A8H6RT20_9PEZI|nr:hypothetical protein HII31_01986 [Pseudocercospora fuligena]